MTNTFIKQNPVFTGDIETDVFVGAEQAFYDWTTSNTEEPYYDAKLDEFLITVKTKHKKFTNTVQAEAAESGTKSLGVFLNRDIVPEKLPEFLKFVKSSRWFVSPRPGSQVKVLVQIPRIRFYETFPEKPKPTLQNLKDRSPQQLAVDFGRFLKDLDKLQEKILNIASFVSGWSGTITGIDFDDEIRNIRNFIDEFKHFLTINGVDLQNPSLQDVNLEMGFEDDGATIVFVALAGIPLLLGTNMLQQLPAIKSKRTIKFISSYQDILKLKDEAWEDFISLFVNHPLSQIVPTLQNAKDTVDHQIENVESGAKRELKKLNGRIADIGIVKNLNNIIDTSQVKSFAKKAQEDKVLTGELKYKISKKREGERDYVGDGIFLNLDTILPKVNTLTDVFEEVYHRVDFRSLIAFMMDCMLPELPEIPDIPDAPQGGINIGEFKEFNIPDFELPSIKLPKLPTVNIFATIRLNLDKLLELLLKEALLALLRMVIDAIVAYCQGDNNLKDGEYGKADIAFPEDPRKIVYIATGIPADLDIVDAFNDDIKDRFTPEELCSLLLGNPNQAVLDALEDFLAGEGVKYKSNFPTKQDILRYFKSLGYSIGQSNILQVCAQTPNVPLDICTTPADIEALNRNLYDIKKRKDGLTDEEIEEQVQLINNIKSGIVAGVVSSLQNPNYLSGVQTKLASKITSFVPKMPANTSSPSASIIRGIFESIEKSFRSDVKQFFQDSRELVLQKDNPKTIAGYKSKLLIDLLNTTMILNEFNIAKSLINVQDREFVVNQTQTMVATIASDKLMTQTIPFGYIPENINSNAGIVLSTVSDLAENAIARYSNLSLYQKTSDTKILNKIILSEISNVYLRLYLLEYLLSGIFSVASLDHTASLFSSPLIRYRMNVDMARYGVSQEITQLLFSGDNSDDIIKAQTQIMNQRIKSIFPGGYKEGELSRSNIEPISFDQYVKDNIGVQNFGNVVLETLTSFWISLLYSKEQYREYFFNKNHVFFRSTKRLLEETIKGFK